MSIKALTTVVLCLAVFYCRSVVSLKTGYTYESKDVNKDELIDDLKCTYLFSGLFHMELIGYMFHNKLTEVREIIFTIIWYNTTSTVYTLYVLDKSKVGVLWLLHLYGRMSKGHLNYSCPDVKTKSDKELASIITKIRSTHDYLIHLLQKEIDSEECRPGNSFDHFDKWMKTKGRKPNVSDIKKAMIKNYEDIDFITDKNLAELPPGLNSESFKFERLFMNNIGSKYLSRVDLMNVYNVQVNWTGTNAQLHNSWENAQILDWKATKLQTFKKYYKLQFSFLKVIFLRLTSKHIMYIEPLAGPTRVSYVEKWHHLVLEFGNMLHISDDPQISELADLMNPLESIDNVKDYLEKVVELLCKTLNCDPTSSITLDGQEFKVPYRSIDQDIAVYVKSVSGEEPVKLNSLANAKAFMLHLTKIFENVDFSVIHSLIKYINEKFK